jgi:protein involved in polysaccharide export with SLBB domain
VAFVNLSWGDGMRNWRLVAFLLGLLSLTSGGCAAVTNPVGVGIPVRCVPTEYLVPSKLDFDYIPIKTLQQATPDAYRLAPGDTLSVYIIGVLGDKNVPPPVRFPEKEQNNLTPSIGYPIPIREDGTLPLPLVEPVKVQGMTVSEAEAAIRKAYTTPKQLLAKENVERILVSLARQRTYHVQVFRQDGSGVNFTAGIGLTQRRNQGYILDLPAYDNDLANALNRTGGLPGLEAVDEVIVQREVKGCGTKISRIPLKVPHGHAPQLSADEVVLNNGDIVFVEGRYGEFFYTAGLLLPRQFPVPRDYDLTVVNAIALGGGPIVNGLSTQNNLSGTITSSGLGSPNPSRVTVIRQTKNHGQVSIIVDLNKALAERSGRENILIQAGDVIVLQETPEEATTRYLTEITHFSWLKIFTNNSHNVVTNTVTLP